MANLMTNSKQNKMYAILDIETTGLSAKQEKITEIAIIIHDGVKVVERFQTLINPERRIPYRITQLTGINDQMVAGAPKFYEVAKKILDFTEGKTIVGHNVTFDYNFIKAEFAEFKYDFQRRTLCTVKMSRKVFPGQPSYSLGKLTRQLGIEHSQKHRAAGDAEATRKLFELILQNDPQIASSKLFTLPKALSAEVVKALPNEAGVYYFLNSRGDVIYVGKSKYIRQRIMQHLNNFSTKKSVEMIDNIADLKYIVTGSELVALLLESDEIKRLKPLYNRAQIRSVFSYGIFMKIDSKGYFDLYVDKNEPLSKPLTTFSSSGEAKDFMHFLADEFNLCHTHCGLHSGGGACFSYQIHKCDGACIDAESPEDYNKKVQKATQRMRFRTSDFFLIDRGRTEAEVAIVEVRDGRYRGFGYIKSAEKYSKKRLQSCIEEKNSNRDSNNILLSWMRNKTYEMILND